MFQLSFKNIQNIFLELSAWQVRHNCRATLVIPPGTSVATIVTICCNHRDGEYFLHRINRKLGSTATSTVIAGLLPLTDYIAGAENETLRALSGHTNGNIEMCSPMMTMVAAATIVRFPPVLSSNCRTLSGYCANHNTLRTVVLCSVYYDMIQGRYWWHWAWLIMWFTLFWIHYTGNNHQCDMAYLIGFPCWLNSSNT